MDDKSQTALPELVNIYRMDESWHGLGGAVQWTPATPIGDVFTYAQRQRAHENEFMERLAALLTEYRVDSINVHWRKVWPAK